MGGAGMGSQRVPSPGGKGHVLEKWDILGAVLRNRPWPEGDCPEAAEGSGARALKEKGGRGARRGWPPWTCGPLRCLVLGD